MNHRNDENERRNEILARGLAAFDDAARRRRTRRRAGRIALAALLVAAGGLATLRLTRPVPAPLPPYVEILVDDRQLVAELELANACERIGRIEGRLVVVECAVPHPPGPRSSRDGASPEVVTGLSYRIAFAFAKTPDR